MLLYCNKLETEAVVYCNSISEFENGQPASDFLEGLLGSKASKLLTPKHASSWGILMTRADFKPSNDPAEWNHWLVCHPSGSLQVADRLKIIDKELQEYKNWVFEQMNDVSPDDEALLASPIANPPEPQLGHKPEEAAPRDDDGPATPSKGKDLLSGLPDITPPRVSETARRRPGAGIAVARPTTGPSVPLSKLYHEHVPEIKTPPRVQLDKPDVVKIVKIELSPDKKEAQIKVEPGVAGLQIKAERGVADLQVKAELGVAELQVKAEPGAPEDQFEPEFPEEPGDPEVPEAPGDPEVPEAPEVPEKFEWDWGESDDDHDDDEAPADADAPERPVSDSEDEMLEDVLGMKKLKVHKEKWMKFCGTRFFVLNG